MVTITHENRQPTDAELKSLPDSQKLWLINGDRGLSSETLFKYTTGVDVTGDWGDNYPYDPADLRRCMQLLEQCPELKSCLPRVAAAGPVWAEYVERWDELTRMLKQEKAGGSGKAPRTYAIMKEIQERDV